MASCVGRFDPTNSQILEYMKTVRFLDKNAREYDRTLLHDALIELNKKLDTLIQISKHSNAGGQSNNPSPVVQQGVVNISRAQTQLPVAVRQSTVDDHSREHRPVPVPRRERMETEDTQNKMLLYQDARSRGYPHEAALKEAGLPPNFYKYG